MKTQKIYSKSNEYQKLEVLKTNRNKRHRYNEFLVEGVRNINEAIRNGWIFNSLIYSFEKDLSSWAVDVIRKTKTQINYELTNPLISDLSDKSDTSELMAVIQMRGNGTELLKLSDNPVLALFDRPSNKGNLGTIIRSCDALGVEGLVITGHAVDLYDPETISASMGSFFKLPVIRLESNEKELNWIAELREKYTDLQVVGTSAHADKTIFECDFMSPVLLLIGNETDGLSYKYKEISDFMTNIPMHSNSSASSFNVACAASIVFYEIARQRANLQRHR
jgi:TrmH family RNA methyltransferase